MGDPETLPPPGLHRVDPHDDTSSSSPKAPINFSERFFSAAAGFGGVAVRTAAAAAALLSDAELRRRGAKVVANNAAKGFKGIQRGLQTVGSGPRQLQSVLQRLAKEMEEQRMHNLIREQRDAPVDVQVGCQVYEDAPQELRSRLWIALLRRPDFSGRIRAAMEEAQRVLDGIADASAGVGPDVKGVEGSESDGLEAPASDRETVNMRASKNIDDVGKVLLLENSDDGVAAETASKGERRTGNRNEPAQPTSPFLAKEKKVDKSTGQEGGETSYKEAYVQRPSSTSVDAEDKDDDWEVVAEKGARRWCEGRVLLSGGSKDRIEPWTASKESLRQQLMTEMSVVPWPLPVEISEESRYGTLLQISVGQEDQDESIARDVHRTFPEYPLFAYHQGQQALFRVLKAYSLHDLEVGYCQGMAFVAGLLLFYVPEEPAFQIFCRLLGAGGSNLRRNYLPGLEGLKAQLKTFEVLLERRLPTLKRHLDEAGAVPVLYASQWFLSVFSCPFPVSFACRLVDIMLLQNSDEILLRVALAIMAECEAELLIQDDFEALLTYLKVTPASWESHKLRRVINAALNSPISSDELKQATIDAEKEDHPLLGRPPTGSKRSKSLGRSIRTEQAQQTPSRSSSIEAGREVSMGGSTCSSSRRSSETERGVTGGGSDAFGRQTSRQGDFSLTKDHSGDSELGVYEEQDLGRHNAELEDAMMRMALDIDRAWWGSCDDEDPVEEVYGRALERETVSDDQDEHREEKK